jgi:hypothetical protein
MFYLKQIYGLYKLDDEFNRYFGFNSIGLEPDRSESFKNKVFWQNFETDEYNHEVDFDC